MVSGILIALVSAALSGWASVAQQRVASAVPVEDGGTLHLDRRERPHLVFQEGTRTPVALCNSAATGGRVGDRSFTIVQGIQTA